jgi:hypothetical protein
VGWGDIVRGHTEEAECEIGAKRKAEENERREKGETNKKNKNEEKTRGGMLAARRERSELQWDI